MATCKGPINFKSLNHHLSVLLEQIPLQLDREGIKEREDGERGAERDDYSRKVIILDIAIKGGNYSRDGDFSSKNGTLFGDRTHP